MITERIVTTGDVWIEHPNDRLNFTRVTIGPLTLWWSYSTLVAFRYVGHDTVIRENEWGPTTGKHLHMIESLPAKSSRVDKDKFLFELGRVKLTAGYEE